MLASNCMQEASENKEGERVMENLDECPVRIMKQLYDIEWRIRRVEYEYKTEKIERSLVKFKCEHIKSEITIMNGVLQLEAYPNPEYLKDHVEGKLKCVIEEVDDVLSFKLKDNLYGEEVGEFMDPHNWLRRHESSSSSDSKLGLVEKEEIEVSKWLSAIAKRMEKIRMLVSQFTPQLEYPPINSGNITRYEKMLSNTSACVDMCIEESLLISPMIATLKKSYDHLPTKLKLCSLCLAAFPENFVIKKIPLIYWWMAEGFITEEVDGEENIMELIRLGFIEPYYYKGDVQRLSSLGVVGACTVHPWIRKMLVSIAMDTQFFEFYGRQQLGGQEKKKISTSPGFHGRPAHACLFWDEGAEYENYHSFMRIIKIVRWVKPGLILCEKEIINKEIKEAMISDGVKGYRHMQEVWDMLFAFRLLILCVSKLLMDNSGVRDRISPWDGDEKHEALLERLRELETDIHQNEKDVQVLFEKQNEMQSDLKKVLMWAKEQVHVLEMLVYDRKRNRQELQRTEQLFARYDLSCCSSSSSSPIHCQCGGKAPLWAIINVNQHYLNLEELLVFGGKLNKLRALHLGTWNHMQLSDNYIENSLVLNALFQVACRKHLKYLSLRGVSGITSLPPSISNCCNLQVLDLKDCWNLEEVPSEIGSLSKLSYFNVSGCSSRLERTSLWAVVAKLKLLRTLKGVALTQDADLISLDSQIIPHNLTKLSIIVNFNFNEVCNLQSLCNLHALKIRWSLEGDVVDTYRYGFELPPQLRKLQLQRYPLHDQNWPAWLKRHPSLETLLFSYSQEITAFPDDLMLPKLQVLWLIDVSKFDKSTMKLGMPRWFPSLKALFADRHYDEDFQYTTRIWWCATDHS
ncbi:PREDICTED: uncharacterized protein LOC109147017 [Ipomoea nil]|uniref:uncharacterized protein LOC109147017 n=1 Tax=Ipomoea nil TaxID=35883 RepID=UPI0009015298|nr:PREDICTED: uncharacterized protein LOC109147017 [Ipomoea nil]